MGRQAKTRIPIINEKLINKYERTDQEKKKQIIQKEKEKHYYNKAAKNLAPLNVRDNVRI